jgi:long-chain acyl-CoA synthetase
MNRSNTDYIGLEVADTLPRVFKERVKRSSDQIGYIQYDPNSEHWVESSWRDMSHRIAQWQAALRREDLNPGDRVAILMKNCCDWVIFDMATMGLGLVTVPLYTNDRAENIGYILQDANIRLLFLDNQEQWSNLQEIHNQLADLNRIVTREEVTPFGLQSRLSSLKDWLPSEYNKEMTAIEVPSESLATIVYTSGTTGRPKGVMLSHHNILWDITSGLNIIDIHLSDHFLSFLPLSHTLERTVGYYTAMITGATTSYNRSIPQLGEDLRIVKPTIMISVPRIFERVYTTLKEKLSSEPAIARWLFDLTVKTGWHRFEHHQGRAGWSPKLLLWPLLDRLVAKKVREKLGGRLNMAVSGGAPLASEIAHVFVGLGVPIIQGYGLTETSPIISANTQTDNIPTSVGIPFPGIEIKIGARDELLCRAPNVMLGYWNNPQATAEVIDADGWFHTGDKAKVEHGHIFITGRIKDIIVMTNGEKVPPADMEMCITMDQLFEQVLVIGEGKPYLTALICLNTALDEAKAYNSNTLTHEQEEALLNRINRLLDNFPGYAKITRLVLVTIPWSVENGMVTPTMKLRRNKILSHHAQELEKIYDEHH